MLNFVMIYSRINMWVLTYNFNISEEWLLRRFQVSSERTFLVWYEAVVLI